MEKAARKIGAVSAKAWLILFIASSLVCVFALRNNNQEMVKLRGTVYTADKDGGDVNAALNHLRDYVYSHMNTDLSSASNGINPPVQLQYTYQRLYDAQASKLQAANQKVYSAAQAYCRATGQSTYGLTTIGCVQNYVVNHGLKAADINIPASLYEFNFVSPTWSPDLAGWSLLASIIFLVAFLLKLSHSKKPGHKK